MVQKEIWGSGDTGSGFYLGMEMLHVIRIVACLYEAFYSFHRFLSTLEIKLRRQ